MRMQGLLAACSHVQVHFHLILCLLIAWPTSLGQSCQAIIAPYRILHKKLRGIVCSRESHPREVFRALWSSPGALLCQMWLQVQGGQGWKRGFLQPQGASSTAAGAAWGSCAPSSRKTLPGCGWGGKTEPPKTEIVASRWGVGWSWHGVEKKKRCEVQVVPWTAGIPEPVGKVCLLLLFLC